MKLVMTLVVRDEADILEAQLAYHLNAGVDFVLATDHASQDGTTEILEVYERQGHLRLFREQGAMRESEWRTRMARLAATEHGADWVINTDADEFWMPRSGTLQEVLAAIPARYGVTWALTRHFVPRPDDGRFFAERMTVRLSQMAPLNDPTSPYRPHAKAAHRADPEIVVLFGSHEVVSDVLAPFRGRYAADVLHFPIRTLAQWERKGVRRAHGDKPLGQYVRAYEASESGTLESLYQALAVDDDLLSRGTRDGSLVLDTRLRDALREDAVGVPGSAVGDELRAVLEGAALREANLVRMCRRVDLLTARARRLRLRSRSQAIRRLRHAFEPHGKSSVR